MTLLVFFGCALTALGPSVAIFWFTIMGHSLRILLTVVGAFAWLLALLLSALLWLAVVPLREELAFALVFSVLFQEAARFGLFKLLDKAHAGLDEALSSAERLSIAGFGLPYVSGFGFGLMAGLFSIVNVLSTSIGPGNVGITGSSSNFFLSSAFLSLATILLNTLWNVILYPAYKKQQWNIIAIVTVMHMTVSCVSLVNSNSDMAYVSLVISYIALCVSAVWAYLTVGGCVTSFKNAFVTLIR